MRTMGFSTGALALGDFKKALRWLYDTNVSAVELSALRKEELEPLVHAHNKIKLSKFKFISVHAPSKYEPHEERKIVNLLKNFSDKGWPIVLHPDSVYSWELWREFGSLLFIENMDDRKPIARDAIELEEIFRKVPEARLCFDIGHAHQHDSTMKNAMLIIDRFRTRIGQIHISEVSTHSQHFRISSQTMHAFQKVASFIPIHIPIILETPVCKKELLHELKVAEKSLTKDSIRQKIIHKTRHLFVSHFAIATR